MGAHSASDVFTHRFYETALTAPTMAAIHTKKKRARAHDIKNTPKTIEHSNKPGSRKKKEEWRKSDNRHTEHEWKKPAHINFITSIDAPNNQTHTQITFHRYIIHTFYTNNKTEIMFALASLSARARALAHTNTGACTSYDASSIPPAA